MSTTYTKTNGKLRAGVAAISSVALFLAVIFLCNITHLADNTNSLHTMFQHAKEPFYLLLILAFPFFLHAQAGHFEKRNIGPLLTGFFFGTFMLYGIAIDQLHDLHPLFANPARIFTMLFVWITLVWFFYLLCLASYRWISQKLSQPNIKEHSIKHIPSWVIVLILAAAWTPYLIIFFPGTICVDNLVMYLWAHNLPDGYFSSHQCVLPTLILGFLPDLYNTLFGSFTLGTFFLVLTSFILLIISIVYMIHTLEKLGAPFWARILTLLWFASTPLFGLFSQWIGKDTISFALGLFFFSLFALALKDIRVFSTKPSYVFSISFLGILLGLFRHERILLIALCFFILILFAIKSHTKKSFIVLLALPILLTPTINTYLEYVTHADSDSSKDTLAMLYNLSARYARDANETIPQNEREDIEQALGDYNRLAGDYLAFSADPVKNPERKNADHIRYLKTWLVQGLRHPIIYLSGLLEQSYGFWALAPQNNHDQDWFFSTDIFTGIPERMHYPGQYRENLEKQRSFLTFIENWRNTPIIGLLNQSSIYVWTMFFITGFALYKKDKRTLCFLLPFFFMWLVCLASPLAASIRYAIGIISATPLFMTFCFCKSNNKTLIE